MSARSEAARAAWTPERRERQREVAKQLVAEGKFGGRQNTRGTGGRPAKRAPSGEVLLVILEAQLRPASWSWPTARDVVVGRRTFSDIAHFVGFDRPQFESLLLTALDAAIVDRQIPEFVLLRSDGVVIAPSPRAHPSTTLRAWRAGREANDLVVIRDVSRADVRRFTDAQIVESLVLLQFIASRTLVRSAIAVALGELATRLRPPVEDALAQQA